MKRNKLILELIHVCDLTGKIKVGSIDTQTLYERFKDGRVSGLLMEDLVATIFTNIVKADSNTDSYDLKDSEGHLYECRTIRLKGTSLIPSKQIGSGREFDEAEHLQKLSWLYGYIFVDIRFMPILTIVAIKSHKLQQKKYITAR